MSNLTPADWDAHTDAINSFHDDAFQHVITWKRIITNLDENGEDGNIRYEDIELRGLMLYNYFRSWPTNKNDQAGEIDKQSCLLYLNSEYLRGLGYLNNLDQFDFLPVEDRVIINGLVYKANGESQAAQAKDKNLLHFIILKREELETGSSKY